MQEIYLSEAENFFDALAHGHKLRDDNDMVIRPLSFGGSGLGIASLHAMAAQGKRAFRPPHVSTERFARKGMLHARVSAGDALVDVVTTHMQSGLGDAARVIRKRQLVELRQFVLEVGRSGAPMIVCGDFNIDGLARNGRADYADIVRALDGFVDLGAAADHVTYDPTANALARIHAPSEPPQRLDYVFVSDPGSALELVSFELALHVAIESEGTQTFASDHYALEATFRR